MSVADSYVYDGFNLDLLLGTQAHSQNAAADQSSLNEVAQHKKKTKNQRSRLAERIADTNALVLQVKQLHDAYTDLQNTCNQVTKLFNQEKLERTAYEQRCNTLSERCAQQEGIIEEKTFIIEQLHGDEHKLSWTRQELVIITMQLAQCLRDNNIKVYGKAQTILKDISEFCSKAKLQYDKLNARSPRSDKQKVLASQSTQTNGLHETPKVLTSSQVIQTGSMEMLNQGTQCLPKILTSSQATQTVLKETYNQGTQYTSTVVTRSTSTKDLEDNFNAFVKPMRLTIGRQSNKLSKKCESKKISKTHSVKTTLFVGPQLPEAMAKLDYRQILNEMLISYVPNPLTPIDPLPLLSVGTCTNLCNVHREIDYLCPHMPVIIKRSNSRPASPANNIKDEPFAANTSYEHSNIAKQILNSLPQSDSCLSSVPPNAFTELWRVFGEMVLRLLQRRTHPAQTNTPADFTNWLYELYVRTQAEVIPVVAQFDKSPCLPNVVKTANLEKDPENDLETAVNFVSKLNVFRQPECANFESELDPEELCLLGLMDTKEKDVSKSNSSNNEQEIAAEICHNGSTSVEFKQVDFNKRDESEKEVALSGKKKEEKCVSGQLQAADGKKSKKRKRITRKAARAKKRKIFGYKADNEFEQCITNNQCSFQDDTNVSPKHNMQTEQTTETRPSVIDSYNAHKKTNRDLGLDSDSDIESDKINMQSTCKPKVSDLCSSKSKAETDKFEIPSIEAAVSPKTKEQATKIAKNLKLISLKSLTQPDVIDSYDKYKKTTTDLGLRSDSDIESDEFNIQSTGCLKTKKQCQQSTQSTKKLKLSSPKGQTQPSVTYPYDEYKKITTDLGLNSDSNIESDEVNIQSTSTADIYQIQPSCVEYKKIAADLDLSSDSDIESDEVNIQSTCKPTASDLCSSNTKAETDKIEIQSIKAAVNPKTKEQSQQATEIAKNVHVLSLKSLTQPYVINSFDKDKKFTTDLGLNSDSDIESDEVNIQSTSTAEVSELSSSDTKASGCLKTKKQCQQSAQSTKKLKLSSPKSQTKRSVIYPYEEYKKITTDLGLNSDSDIESDEVNIQSTSTAFNYQIQSSCVEYKKIAADLDLSSDSDIASDEVNIQSTCKPTVSDLCSSNTKAETDKIKIQSIKAAVSPKTIGQSQQATEIAKNVQLLSLKSLKQPYVINSFDKDKKFITDLGLNSDSDIESDEFNIQSTSTAEVSELSSSDTKPSGCLKTKKQCQQSTQSTKKLKLSSPKSQTQRSVIYPYDEYKIITTDLGLNSDSDIESDEVNIQSTSTAFNYQIQSSCVEYKKIAADLDLSSDSDIASDEVNIQSTCKPTVSDLCSSNTKAETDKIKIQSIKAAVSPKTIGQSQQATEIAKNVQLLSLKSLKQPYVINSFDKDKKFITDLGLNSDSDIESDEFNIQSTSTAEVSELSSSDTKASGCLKTKKQCQQSAQSTKKLKLSSPKSQTKRSVIYPYDEYKIITTDLGLNSDSDIESDEVNIQSTSTADNYQIQPSCVEYKKIAADLDPSTDSDYEFDEVTKQSTSKEYVSDLYLSNAKAETDKFQIQSIKKQACDRLNDFKYTDSYYAFEKISTALGSESDSGIKSYKAQIQSTNKPVITETDEFNIQSTKSKACDKVNEQKCTDSYDAYEKIYASLDLDSDYDIDFNEVQTQSTNKPELTSGSKKFEIDIFETNRDCDRMKVNKERHSYDSDPVVLDISTNLVFQELILSDCDNEQELKNMHKFGNPPSPEPNRLVIDDSDSDAEEELLSTETNSMQNSAASKTSHLEVEPTGEPVIRFGLQNTSEANCDEQQVINLPSLGYFRETAEEIINCDNVLEPNELSNKTSKVSCSFDDTVVLGYLQETANISKNCDNILEPNEPMKETAKPVCSFDYSPASPVAKLEDDQKFIVVHEEKALGQRSDTKALVVHATDLMKKVRRGRPKMLITRADERKQKILTKKITEFLKPSPDVSSTCKDFVATLDSITKKEVVIINAFINAFRTLDIKDNEAIRLQPALRLFELKKPDFLQRFIEALNERLFRVKDKPLRKQAHNFVKLYLLLIEVQANNTNSAEYKNPARYLMAKILYYYKVDMPLLINEIVSKYPTVLPHRDERHYDNSDPLITVIKHLLMTHKYNMTDPLSADRCLLNMLRYNYYHFTQYSPTKEEVLKNLVEKLKAGKLQDLSFAFALFCKRAIALQVTSSVLGANLMPLAFSYCTNKVYDERLEAAVTSISLIVKQQPRSTDVSSYMALFQHTLLVAPHARTEEAAVRAILRLQRFRFQMCVTALQNYKPNYELTSSTRMMLASFVRRYRQYRFNANKKK